MSRSSPIASSFWRTMRATWRETGLSAWRVANCSKLTGCRAEPSFVLGTELSGSGRKLNPSFFHSSKTVTASGR